MTQFVLETRAFVNFRRYDFAEPGAHGYRWVDVRSFRFPQDVSDRELLGLLVAHEQFRDDYAGGDVDPAGSRHGPYWLRNVTAHAYQQVAKAQALAVGGVHTEFHEFVMIDRENPLLQLVVAADD